MRGEWINVAPLRETPYRRPEEFLEHISEFGEVKESLAEATAVLGVAHVDQAIAAADESEARVRQAAEFMSETFGWTHAHHERGTPKDFALHLAVAAAVFRRCTIVCRHFDLQAARPVEAWLSANLISCTACMAEMARIGDMPVVIDDGRCDLCDEPETIFLEAVHQFGHLTVLMNVCRSCARFMGFKSKPPGPPRRRRRRQR